MQFSKVNLGSVRAIAHDDEKLGLVIERGDQVDVIEVPAPIAAYEGLQLLNAIVNSGSISIESATFNNLPGSQSVAMQPVRSSMAKAIGYDRGNEILQVEFNNGSIYQYDHVDEQTWHELQDTDSLGSFFNRQIKGIYPSQRLC
jgi:KTSC domain